MKLLIYTAGDNCDACQLTIKWLEERGIEYQIVNLNDYNRQWSRCAPLDCRCGCNTC